MADKKNTELCGLRIIHIVRISVFSCYSTLRNTELSGSRVSFELLERTFELSLSSMPVN